MIAKFMRRQVRISFTVGQVLLIVAFVVVVDVAWPARPGWLFWPAGFALGAAAVLMRERSRRRS